MERREGKGEGRMEEGSKERKEGEAWNYVVTVSVTHPSSSLRLNGSTLNFHLLPTDLEAWNYNRNGKERGSN